MKSCIIYFVLHIGKDLLEHELPHLVKDEFFVGAPFLHITGIDLESLSFAEQAEKIRGISQAIGRVTFSSSDPNSDVWLLDSRTSPHAQLVEPHTDNPFKDTPEDIVAFWNIRSSARGGENVITPLDRVLELGERSDRLAEDIQNAQAPSFTFTGGEESWRGPVIDLGTHTIRYDAKYLDNSEVDFRRMFEEAIKVGDSIKLAPGDVLFFSNTTTVHARLPYSDPNRLSIRTRISL